jgi:ketosteroid isomerase-like protein
MNREHHDRRSVLRVTIGGAATALVLPSTSPNMVIGSIMPSAHAQAPLPQTTNKSMGEPATMHGDPLPELRALNAKFIHNFVTNDVPSHDAIIHQRFMCIMPNGIRMGRDDYLKHWAHAFDPEVLVYWDYRNEVITTFGNVALVVATNKHTRRKDGHDTTGMTTYTDTYLRQEGSWKCIHAQLTSVSPEHHPSDDTIVRKYIKGKIVE